MAFGFTHNFGCKSFVDLRVSTHLSHSAVIIFKDIRDASSIDKKKVSFACGFAAVRCRVGGLRNCFSSFREKSKQNTVRRRSCVSCNLVKSLIARAIISTLYQWNGLEPRDEVQDIRFPPLVVFEALSRPVSAFSSRQRRENK